MIISGDEGLNVTGITGGMMTSHPWCPFSGLNYYVTFRLRQCYVKCYLDSKSKFYDMIISCLNVCCRRGLSIT